MDIIEVRHTLSNDMIHEKELETGIHQHKYYSSEYSVKLSQESENVQSFSRTRLEENTIYLLSSVTNCYEVNV